MDLWVLPSPNQSQWFSRLDWYLNWQMCKGLAFEKARPSVELFRVLEEGELQFEAHPSSSPNSPQWPLLVISQGRIPCAKCVVIENSKSLATWLEAVRGVAQRLNAKNVRVFLPAGSSLSEAQSLWKSADNTIEFCLDEDAL